MTGGKNDFYRLVCRSWSAPFQGKASRILRSRPNSVRFVILPNLIRRDDIISFFFFLFFTIVAVLSLDVRRILPEDVKYDKTMVAYRVNS